MTAMHDGKIQAHQPNGRSRYSNKEEIYWIRADVNFEKSGWSCIKTLFALPLRGEVHLQESPH
jgi:hypothetical protein